MMRKMVKQMRTGREWRATSQDGAITIIFFVEYWQDQENNNMACVTSEKKAKNADNQVQE